MAGEHNTKRKMKETSSESSQVRRGFSSLNEAVSSACKGMMVNEVLLR